MQLPAVSATRLCLGTSQALQCLMTMNYLNMGSKEKLNYLSVELESETVLIFTSGGYMKYIIANIVAFTLLLFLAGCAGMGFQEIDGYGGYPGMGYGGYGDMGGYPGMGYGGYGGMGGYEGMGGMGGDDDDGGDDD